MLDDWITRWRVRNLERQLAQIEKQLEHAQSEHAKATDELRRRSNRAVVALARHSHLLNREAKRENHGA